MVSLKGLSIKWPVFCWRNLKCILQQPSLIWFCLLMYFIVTSRLTWKARESIDFGFVNRSEANKSMPAWTLQWCHNERHGVSNLRHLHCFSQQFVQVHIKQNIKAPRITCLCEGNPPVTDGFPSQRASNAENVSIWWRHHELVPNSSASWGFRGNKAVCICFGVYCFFSP